MARVCAGAEDWFRNLDWATIGEEDNSEPKMGVGRGSW
jgi:hypothetical protein